MVARRARRARRPTTKNGTEADVDCGRACPGQLCTPGQACAADQDCDSLVCDAGNCQPASCSDRAINQGESDLNCGGPCANCPTGSLCRMDSDCASNDCGLVAGKNICRAPPGVGGASGSGGAAGAPGAGGASGASDAGGG